jgi:hypothetical protein
VRWNALAMYANAATGHRAEAGIGAAARDVEAARPTRTPQAALGAFPFRRRRSSASTRSSRRVFAIISDEGLSRETGRHRLRRVMSDEPQGALKIRRNPTPTTATIAATDTIAVSATAATRLQPFSSW